MRIKKNDNVLIIAGKDRGKKGPIIRVLPNINKVVVEGVNTLKRHTKPTPKQPHGGIIEFFAPIDISNVQLICPECSKKIRFSIKILKNNKKVRICKSCQASVDIKNK